MKFLIDRCAGRRLAEWLTEQGDDTKTAWADALEDPGDRALLQTAADEGRILVTIDSDFGTLVRLFGMTDDVPPEASDGPRHPV